MSHDFYRRLEPIASFIDVADPGAYAPAPSDWYVIITDVRGSTKAVEAGRYKEVNVLGAASIVTVLNACAARDLPFAFGGDGATLLVTANELDRATAALLGLARTAREVFDMDLRVGVVPVQELADAGHDVGVAKYRLSDDIDLAMFWGTGLGVAEDLIKGAETEEQYTLKPSGAAPHPDVSGLECRWKPIANRNGRMVSLIVLARAEDESGRAAAYREVLEFIESLASDSGEFTPISTTQMNLAADPAAFEPETRVRTGTSAGIRHAVYKAQARFITAAGRFLVSRGLRAPTFDGAEYPKSVVLNTDFRKFDDVLRMVVDVSEEQKAELVEFLEAAYAAERLFYGVHEADAAMMTCLVFDHDRDHVHFIDGADGGYALAAKQLKAQLKAAESAT